MCEYILAFLFVYNFLKTLFFRSQISKFKHTIVSIRVESAAELFARQLTPSMRPLSAPMNGFEKCLSSFTAFSARTYPRPFSKVL